MVTILDAEVDDKPRLVGFGQHYLRKVMAENGLTVTALAGRLGISRKHLSAILHGKAPLVDPMLSRIAEASGADLALLRAAARPKRTEPLARWGDMKGMILWHGDLTEPMVPDDAPDDA